MKSFYIPYSGNRIVTLNVNGHKLLILSEDPEVLADDLGTLGAKRLRKLDEDFTDGSTSIVDNLAKKYGAGLVFASDEVALSDLISDLKQKLPWIN